MYELNWLASALSPLALYPSSSQQWQGLEGGQVMTLLTIALSGWMNCLTLLSTSTKTSFQTGFSMQTISTLVSVLTFSADLNYGNMYFVQMTTYLLFLRKTICWLSLSTTRSLSSAVFLLSSISPSSLEILLFNLPISSFRLPSSSLSKSLSILARWHSMLFSSAFFFQSLISPFDCSLGTSTVTSLILSTISISFTALGQLSFAFRSSKLYYLLSSAFPSMSLLFRSSSLRMVFFRPKTWLLSSSISDVNCSCCLRSQTSRVDANLVQILSRFVSPVGCGAGEQSCSSQLHLSLKQRVCEHQFMNNSQFKLFFQNQTGLTVFLFSCPAISHEGLSL